MRFVNVKPLLRFHTVYRLLPVMIWSVCSVMLALGFVLHRLHSLSLNRWEIVIGILLVCTLMQRVFRQGQRTIMSNHPFLIEWGSVFPFIVSSSLMTYYLLTHSLENRVVWASIIHGLLCVSWYVQYQLCSYESVKGNSSYQFATISWLTSKYRLEDARQLPAAYFLVAAFVSILATLHIDHTFLFSLFVSLLGAVAAWNTNHHLLPNVTYQQIRMSIFIITHTLFLFVTEIFFR